MLIFYYFVSISVPAADIDGSLKLHNKAEERSFDVMVWFEIKELETNGEYVCS